MSLAAGRRRHRITYQQTGGQNADGSPSNAWQDVGTPVWCSIDPLSALSMTGAREFLAGANVASSQDIVRVTHSPRLVQNDWRFIHKGNAYNVVAARVDNANSTMTVYATLTALTPAP